MDSGKVKFFLGEVLRNFSRNAGMQMTAIGTVAITIVLLGIFLFVRADLASIGQKLLDQIEISAYLKTDVDARAGHRDLASLAHDPRVASAQFVPKKQGLAELRQRTKGTIDTALLTENPLPDKFRIKARVPDDVPARGRERAPAQRRGQRRLRPEDRAAPAAAWERAPYASASS